MLVYVALVVSVLGLVIYLGVKQTPDLKEVGRLMFAVGLLVFLFLWPRVLVLR